MFVHGWLYFPRARSWPQLLSILFCITNRLPDGAMAPGNMGIQGLPIIEHPPLLPWFSCRGETLYYMPTCGCATVMQFYFPAARGLAFRLMRPGNRSRVPRSAPSAPSRPSLPLLVRMVRELGPALCTYVAHNQHTREERGHTVAKSSSLVSASSFMPSISSFEREIQANIQ